MTLSLGTADPVEARRFVPRLSARWEMMAIQMFNRASRGFLQAQELTRIFRAGLDEDLDQRRRVIRSFGWITGDKRLCDYGSAGALHYAQTLRKLPTVFRRGTPDAGAMSRPLKEVVVEVDAMAKKTPRSDRTYNCDLTIMARFSRDLAKASWRPRFGKDPMSTSTSTPPRFMMIPPIPTRCVGRRRNWSAPSRLRSSRAAGAADD
jgi:hypothetical protein